MVKFINSKEWLENLILLFDRGDNQSLKQVARRTNWNVLKHDNDNINTCAENITTNITEMARKHIPNKTVKVRPSDPSWLTKHIKKISRKITPFFINLKEQKGTMTSAITNHSVTKKLQSYK